MAQQQEQQAAQNERLKHIQTTKQKPFAITASLCAAR
jgi:hypothetical protein